MKAYSDIGEFIEAMKPVGDEPLRVAIGSLRLKVDSLEVDLPRTLFSAQRLPEDGYTVDTCLFYGTGLATDFPASEVEVFEAEVHHVVTEGDLLHLIIDESGAPGFECLVAVGTPLSKRPGAFGGEVAELGLVPVLVPTGFDEDHQMYQGAAEVIYDDESFHRLTPVEYSIQDLYELAVSKTR